ncbi:hypothetical protein BT96DRAFT_1081453 [Gymnopus androsaceus JB14]|uniref:Uncharacterized protein n=1 Tax=Gymnopus androsaceus JB14 TaxID=1447944 RepID=A0A6A4GP52_9AGAR|nr:hypothetical protein BT96DRAFT_1081453 [Gymnopus androsaceus JB14]
MTVVSMCGTLSPLEVRIKELEEFPVFQFTIHSRLSIMFKISALALSAILFIGVSANPLRRDTCNPNAQGSPVSILKEATGFEWAAPNMFNILGEPYTGSLEFPGWKIPQTGEFPTSYFIEDVATPGMMATINAGELDLNTLNNEIFQPIGPDAGDPLRNFGCSTVGSNEIYTIMT